jgi:hypothetical protein
VKAPAALVVLALAACSTENTRLRDARDAFYSAISHYDHNAIRAAVVAGYVSADRGRFFNVDSLIADVTLLEAESLSAEFAFVDSASHVDPPMGWIVYRSRRVLAGPRYTDTTYAVESAVFKREGNGWRLAMLHRTPVANAAEFFDPRPAAPPPVAPATAPAQPRPARPRPPNG